jgi:hypothetical protein
MRSWKLEYPTRLAALAATPALAIALSASPAAAQTSPRVLVIFDTSGSMLWDYQDIEACGGDGSQTYPHRLCDDALGSKLYHAKAALSDIVQSAGGTEFGLMRYHQLERGEAGFGGRQLEVGAQYYSAAGAEVATNYDGVTEGCQPADLLVSPSANSAPDVLEWMDGVENFPGNKELRGNGYTPPHPLHAVGDDRNAADHLGRSREHLSSLLRTSADRRFFSSVRTPTRGTPPSAPPSACSSRRRPATCAI